ncbi:MAG TPA: hypothetical protein VGM77_02995 [Gemmatimonadales bacterium]|jgi:hypothetical protein
MPKRSNIFQRLVAGVHSSLGAGWAVAESVELTDSVTGEPREVDVVADATIGGYRVLLCIEVRDRKRPADVTWVEAMARKHQDLPTNKLVLWSPTGFSSSARVKASALAIDLVAPGDGTKAPWALLARDLVGATVKLVRPSFEVFADVEIGSGINERWPAPNDMILKQSGGSQHATVGAILRQIADSPEVRTALLDHAPDGSGSFHGIYHPPFPATAVGPNGVERSLNRLVIGISTVAEVAHVRSRSVVHAATVTTLAEARMSDGRLELLAHEPVSGSSSVTVTFLPKSGSA